MNGTEKQALEILHNLNWLLEPHESFVELIAVKGEQVVVRCMGACVGCETDCIGTVFKERMPHIELIRQ